MSESCFDHAHVTVEKDLNLFNFPISIFLSVKMFRYNNRVSFSFWPSMGSFARH